MSKGILARKVGMTQVFDEHGRSFPVTVLKAGPCYVVQVKAAEQDGYNSVQLGFEPQAEQRVNQPLKGHYRQANIAPCRYLREFRVDDPQEYTLGQQLNCDIFSPGDYVDVRAITKGKGFAGSIKRHGFSRGPESHGSHYHRGPGSLGAVDQARVFKGRPLPGRMGRQKRVVQNLQVAQVDSSKHLLLVKGSIPGPRGALVEVRTAAKAGR
ncbi:MAG TPA: 50S ribosomal protein L3 [Firmicutes bacterium]|nr:50S ribosomal protein L3 [Bacillota bacterium]